MVNNDVIGSCGTCDEHTPLTEDDLAVAFGEKTAAGHEEPCAGCDEEGYDPCAGCNPCEGCVSQYCKGCTPCKGCEWYVEDDADSEDFEPYETAEEQSGASDKIILAAAGVLMGVILIWGWGDPWTLSRVVVKAALMAAVVFGAKRLINEDDWVWTFDYDRWKTAVVALGSAAIFAFLERHLWVANIGVVLGIIALALRKIMPPKVYAAEGDDDESDDDGSDEDEESDEDDDEPEDADLDDA